MLRISRDFRGKHFRVRLFFRVRVISCEGLFRVRVFSREVFSREVFSREVFSREGITMAGCETNHRGRISDGLLNGKMER